jgi:hypothetical protein
MRSVSIISCPMNLPDAIVPPKIASISFPSTTLDASASTAAFATIWRYDSSQFSPNLDIPEEIMETLLINAPSAAALPA